MAASPSELERFVRDALLRHIPHDGIRLALTNAGWSEEQIRSALAAYADTDFPVPVPRPSVQLSARDAFLYLVLFTTLYLSAFNVAHLLFVFIERAVPDIAARSYGSIGSSIRWSVSTLIIAFPIFLWLSAHIGRELRQAPIKRLSAVRRWLTYITLFIGAIILIGDLVTLVYHLLGGELTLRFVLKAIVVALIAGGIFGYYLGDLRRDERLP